MSLSTLSSSERQEMMKLSIKQLKTKCKTLGVSSTGNKMEIVNRIITKTHNLVNSFHHICIEHTPPPYYEDESQSDIISDTLKSCGYEIIHEINSNYYNIQYVGNTIQKSEKFAYGQKITIKKFQHIFNTNWYTKTILKELRILKSLNHNNIIKLYDIIPPINANKFKSLTVVLEFVASDLETIFHTNQFFTPLHIQYMFYQILLGIKYMHSKYIAHLNLKSSVILINENCSIKISDFMNAHSFYNNLQSANFNNMITLYTAPEIILSDLCENNEDYFNNIAAIDIWSIGCIFGEFLQMLNENVSNVRDRKPLFYGNTNIEQLKCIFNIIGIPKNNDNIKQLMNDMNNNYNSKQSELRVMFNGCDEYALDLIHNLLVFDVNKRFDIDAALKHKYFDQVRDKKLEIMKNEWINDLSLDFEKKSMRILVLDEVEKYKCDKYAVLNGYIRQYIMSLMNNKLMKIPDSVIKVLYMYIAL